MKKFFHSILILISILTIGVLISLGYMYFKYRNWEKSFEQDLNIDNLIDQDIAKSTDLGAKISTFALSAEDVEFLQLDISEIGSEIYNTLDSYLGEKLKLEKIYIEPSNSKWVIYSQVRYEKFLIWFSFDVNKDSIQSAQIYVTQINIGPFRISKYVNWVDAVNTGIADSIITLNENGLVGRYIENIELLNNSVVLKGSRY
ncbi:hypothetical protein GX618_00545 [Candidatus Dojkabacteria bacterium]|uniref:Uncharacterized protein n=1 Tax=Candidatus Dojkabacteria bacterium TaxID=2099670 RepID=A0A847ESM8_9BACT|nr:hypothetical protein [Candidatus Dojkabacteria bacterium]